MDALLTIERKKDVRHLPAPPAGVRQRMATAAATLSRAGDVAAHVELANEALAHYTAVLYQRSPDGFYDNIDFKTGRVLVAAPWGNKGWKRWGLRHWEAVRLRQILMLRIAHPRHIVMFDYNTEMRCWFLAANHYPTFEAAQAYLKHCAITVAEWRSVAPE